MTIYNKLVDPSHGLKYPVVARPYTDDMEAKEKVFTKDGVMAILTELQLEIEETYKKEKSIDKKWANGLHYSEKIIQQKISSLKEVKDGSN